MTEPRYLPTKSFSESKAKGLTLNAWKITGGRFFIEQNTIELLSELLLVLSSRKTVSFVGKDDEIVDSYFFNMYEHDELERLEYEAPVNLLLKLFALFDISDASNAFPAHKEGHEALRNDVRTHFTGRRPGDNWDDELDVLEAMLQGFQIAGVSRDWCAQSFIPISKDFLAAESIWRATEAKKAGKNDDGTAFNSVIPYFEHTSRDFYSRGGEVLYLQLILALSSSPADIDRILHEQPLLKGFCYSQNEKDPQILRGLLEKGFARMLENDSSHLADFIKLIESSSVGRPDSANSSEDDDSLSTVRLQTGWIPETDVTRALGYLFAVELSRLFASHFEPVQMVTEMELACVMQVIRTYLYSSAMANSRPQPMLITVSPFTTNGRYKTISNNSFKEAMTLIRTAIVEKDDSSKGNQVSKYGANVFRKLAKSIGFVVPRKGDTEHFVITKDLLTLFVSTALRPGEPMAIDDFIDDLKVRYRIAVDCDSFSAFNQIIGINQKISDPEMYSWLVEMLDECGYYQPLSDSISLVINTNVPVTGESV